MKSSLFFQDDAHTTPKNLNIQPQRGGAHVLQIINQLFLVVVYGGLGVMDLGQTSYSGLHGIPRP